MLPNVANVLVYNNKLVKEEKITPKNTDVIERIMFTFETRSKYNIANIFFLIEAVTLLQCC